METNKWYHQAVETVIEQLKVEFGNELLGILLGRSVARESLHKQSDLDIYAIIRSSWRQQRAFVVAGVDVQVWINPAHQIQKEFQNTDTPETETLDHFANGRVLYDPESVMAYLVQQAQYIWQQPRPAIPTKQVPKLRHTPIAQLKHAQDLLEVDEVAATVVMYNTLEFILDVYYKLQRRWTVQPKHQLRDLHEHAPEIESLVRCVLSSNISVKQRCVHLSQLVDQVLEPLGGPLEEWTTAPESVPFR